MVCNLCLRHDVCLLYSADYEQSARNEGHTDSAPLVAAINCTLWVTYALLKKNRDYPVAMANAPGIIFGLIAAITAII